MDYILGEAQNNPTSRRLNMELWNVDDLEKMNLPPCAHHWQVMIKNGKVNMVLKQRSADFVTANAFNVAEYAILVHMIARHLGLEAGELVHVIVDCHLYNKHEELALKLLSREPFPAPIFWLNPEKTDFYSFTREDVKLLCYEKHEQLRMEVAI
jgi:thymidylate synthase